MQPIYWGTSSGALYFPYGTCGTLFVNKTGYQRKYGRALRYHINSIWPIIQNWYLHTHISSIFYSHKAYGKNLLRHPRTIYKMIRKFMLVIYYTLCRPGKRIGKNNVLHPKVFTMDGSSIVLAQFTRRLVVQFFIIPHQTAVLLWLKLYTFPRQYEKG